MLLSQVTTKAAFWTDANESHPWYNNARFRKNTPFFVHSRSL